MPCVPNGPQRSTRTNPSSRRPTGRAGQSPHARIRNRSADAGRSCRQNRTVSAGRGAPAMCRKCGRASCAMDRASCARAGSARRHAHAGVGRPRLSLSERDPNPVFGTACVSKPIDVSFGWQTQSRSLTRFFVGFRVASDERDAARGSRPAGGRLSSMRWADAACRHAIETSRSASHRRRFPETGLCPCLL